MTIVKLWMCGSVKEIHNAEEAKKVMTETSESVSKMMMQSIFQNTSGEVVTDKDGIFQPCFHISKHILDFHYQIQIF